MESITLNIKKNIIKIALLGSYPPPYGGVSVHIQRLKKKLEEINIKTIVYDFFDREIKKDNNVITVKKPIRWIIKYFFTAKENIIHSHFSEWRIRSIIAIMSFINKKTIITIHGDSLKQSLDTTNWIKKKIIKFSLKHTSYIIATNEDIKQLCLNMEVKPTRISVVPAFIPPSIIEDEINDIPTEIWTFINTHSPIISANAFEIRFNKNEDLYGIDMCIDLCINLMKEYPTIGLIFFLPNIGDYNYYNKLKNIIIKSGIKNNFLFVNKEYQFYPILINSNVFIRPTNTDGDSISIREALYFNIPVVASDCVERPKSTILFRNRDTKDFILRVNHVLNNIKDYKKQIELKDKQDNFAKILEIYKNI